MKLSEFESFIRLIVPSANSQRVSQSRLRLLINKGVRKINVTGKVLTKKGYFNAVADTGEYTITDQSGILDYVLVGESGVWYNNGTEASPNYIEVEGADRTYLNEKIPNWHSAGSGQPKYAVFDPNLIVIVNKPSASLTNGFMLPDYVYNTVDMTLPDHYPFSGSTVEWPNLEVLDDAIIDYVRWMLRLSIGKKQEGIVTRQEYDATVNLAIRLLNRRPDFRSNSDFRLSGRRRY